MLCQELALKYRMLAKDLFLKYALPCLHNKVERGEMSEDEFKDVVKRFKRGEITDEEINEWFPVAVPNVATGAINAKKDRDGVAEVDEQVVRQYFWRDHDQVVRQRKHPGDVELCLVLPAKVEKLDSLKAEVRHPFGKRIVNTIFINEPREGDYITIHYYFGCEKISEEEAKELWKKKS